MPKRVRKRPTSIEIPYLNSISLCREDALSFFDICKGKDHPFWMLMARGGSSDLDFFEVDTRESSERELIEEGYWTELQLWRQLD